MLMKRLCISNRTLAHKDDNVHGMKRDKERVTILVMVNSNGSYKNRLMLIGKSKNPRCLRTLNLNNLPLNYRSGKNAWMNSHLFTDFLHSFDKDMRKLKRHVLLLLDNCGPHTKALDCISLSNVNVQFIRPNLTSVIQPCDAGIIRSLKAQYRRLFLEFVDSHSVGSETQRISLKDAIYLVSDAWAKVSELTISNCWNKVDILPEGRGNYLNIERCEQEHYQESIELSFLIASVQQENSLTVDEYLGIENTLESNINDSEIVSRIISELSLDINSAPNNEPEPKEEDDDDKEESPILCKEGLSHLNHALVFLEQQDFANESEIRIIRDLIAKTLIKMANGKNFKQSSIKNYFS